jgi:hypothetical protein
MNVCKRYSFKVIDIYNDSCLSAVPIEQITPTAKKDYWYVGAYNTGVSSSIALHAKANPITVSDLRFFDWKGLHPTKFGYEVGYAPLVKAALKLATRK